MIDLRFGDCLEKMAEIEAQSIDLVLSDPPYGTTANRWDQVIPFDPLWSHYRRVLKPRGAVVLMASQPFTSMLVMSNLGWFKYSLVWEKEVGTNFYNANYQPLKVHEDIIVFSPAASCHSHKGVMTYNPQMVDRRPTSGGSKRGKSLYRFHGQPLPMRLRKDAETCHPRSVILCQREMGLHGTQKPVPLMEYLIRTYSNEGETVLDNCVGSGTTLIACLNTNRHGLGIEKDPEIFSVAERRINAELARTALFA